MRPAAKIVRLPTGLSLSHVDIGVANSKYALVLLPGLSDSWRSYELLLPHLPESIRTIAISQRGHGDSDKPPAGYSVRHFASDLRALLDAYALSRVVLVGHSSASLVARRFALDHPARIAGLVLEGSFVKLERIPTEVRAKFAGLEDPLTREFVRDFASGTVTRRVPNEFLDAMLDESLKAPAHVWSETFAGVIEYDDMSELATLGASTLILWGDQDTIVDWAATEALHRAIPSSRLLVYEGIGHTPHWEDPIRFAKDVAVFVDQCRQR